MSALPNDLALTTIPDETEIVASDHRNNYSAIQAAVNALRDALAGGSSGQVVLVVDGTHIDLGLITNANIDAAAAIVLSKIKAGTSHTLLLSGASTVGSLAAGSAGQLLKSNGASADPSWGEFGYARVTTSATVSNSIAETDLLGGLVTVTANSLGTSRRLRLTCGGDWKQNAGANHDIPQFKLKLGATTLLDSNVIGSNVVGNIVGRFPWRFVCEIANLGAANSQLAVMAGRLLSQSSAVGDSQFLTGTGRTMASSSGGGTLNIVTYDGENTTAVDTTADQALTLTVTLPVASANTDIVCKSAIVEIL